MPPRQPIWLSARSLFHPQTTFRFLNGVGIELIDTSAKLEAFRVSRRVSRRALYGCIKSLPQADRLQRLILKDTRLPLLKAQEQMILVRIVELSLAARYILSGP